MPASGRVLLPMECHFSSHPLYEDQEHHAASVQSRKYSKSAFAAKFKGLEDGFRSTQGPALLSYKELGGF